MSWDEWDEADMMYAERRLEKELEKEQYEQEKRKDKDSSGELSN